MALIADDFFQDKINDWLSPEVTKNLEYVDNSAELLITRGAMPDYKWSGKEPKPNDHIDENGQGTRAYNKLHSSGYPMSILGKISALTLDGTPTMEYQTFDYMEYARKYNSYEKLCSIFSDLGNGVASDSTLRVPGLEYYPDDFLYTAGAGYPLNRMITLRRFPYPCIDNILDPSVQQIQDVTRMVTHWDDETNRLEDILGFSYGLNWRQLNADFQAMEMQGSGNVGNEGLTGYMQRAAMFFGDDNIVKNRLRGANGNMIAPTADQNKTAGPVDSIASTHIRDVGLNFDKSFNIKFTYKSRSIGGRNPEAVMKDIIGNALLCTFNDGEFWGGSRFWLGSKPSNAVNKLQWMNSDNLNTILNGAYNSLIDLVSSKFGSKEKRIETLKKILKGGIQYFMAGILNTMGRPGVPFANSILSGSPVGEWHLTIGHPLNPIMTIGNLICDNVEVKFPDDTLSYGDFPTTVVFEIRLKPAMPRDRAGIELMFNHGQKRIYQPAVVKMSKNRGTGRHRTFIDDMLVKADNLTTNALYAANDGVVKGSKYLAKGAKQGAAYLKDYGESFGDALASQTKYVIHSFKDGSAGKAIGARYYAVKSSAEKAVSNVTNSTAYNQSTEYIKNKANEVKSAASSAATTVGNATASYNISGKASTVYEATKRGINNIIEQIQ